MAKAKGAGCPSPPPASPSCSPFPRRFPAFRSAQNTAKSRSAKNLHRSYAAEVRPETTTAPRRAPLANSDRMAGVTGLEPATSGVTGRRSNQLSYTPAFGGRFLALPHPPVKGFFQRRERSSPMAVPAVSALRLNDKSTRGNPRHRGCRAGSLAGAVMRTDTLSRLPGTEITRSARITIRKKICHPGRSLDRGLRRDDDRDR